MQLRTGNALYGKSLVIGAEPVKKEGAVCGVDEHNTLIFYGLKTERLNVFRKGAVGFRDGVQIQIRNVQILVGLVKQNNVVVPEKCG